MRIRKNAKLSTLMFSHASTSETLLQTHVCQLNQSPWDVITFPPDSTTSSYPTEHQLEAGEYSFTGNVSIGDDSIGAVESIASMKISTEEKKREKEVDNGVKKENGIGLRRDSVSCCNKADGKGWQCRREAKEGHSLCEHHLAQLRSYNSLSHPTNRKSDKPPPAKVAGGYRRPGRGAKKAPTSNPYEFYYYSGFGPLWGKKRGDKPNKSNTKVVEVANETTPSSSSQIDNSNDNDEELDLVDDDDDDDDENSDENGDTGRKRTRKPVKARSLKSLM